ncbi:MAG: 6-bladed beta-propeller [Bacteroidales bacterium]|nr:6-bladed beta-propeller [Bacteroidales bacterium]
MKMKPIYFFAFFSNIIFLFLSCNLERKPTQNEHLIDFKIRQIIDQNSKDFFLSELGKSIKYLPLESPPELLLSFINRLQIWQDNIFVSDREGVYQFDSNGKFVREMGSIGRGPGEHTGRVRFSINPYREEVYIYSFPTKLINVYQISTGDFLYSFYFDYYVSDFYLNENNQVVFFTEEGSSEDLNFSVNEAYLVENEALIDSISNPLRPEKRSNIVGHVLLYQNQNDAFYCFNYSDTLFWLDQNFKRKPYAKFNLENKNNYLILGLDYGFTGIQFPDFYYIDNVLANSEFFFVNIGKGFAMGVDRDLRRVLYSKKDGKSWEIKKIINDLDGGLPFWPRWVSEGVLINYHHPHEIIDYYNETKGEITHGSDFVRLVSSLKETDNPVLVFME